MDNYSNMSIQSHEITLDQNPITLGRGTFATVIRGKCRGQDVAIKLLDDNLRRNTLEALKTEFDLMTNSTHPNVVLCLGVCMNPKCIVMELLSGTLTSKLNSNLPLSKKFQYALDICKGMAWLCGKNILHRDLKPDNILLDANDNCKVSDFGLSQIVRGENTTNTMKGSPYWMAPEVLSGKKVIDTKADVYSFGLIFWQILTKNQKLFTEYSDFHVFTDHIAYQGKRPSLEGINPILQRILQSTWHHLPKNRNSFVQLIQSLEIAIIEYYFDVCACGNQNHIPMPNGSLSFRTGSWLWKEKFSGHVRVSWSVFLNALNSELPNQNYKNAIETMRTLICEGQENDEFVTIEKFRNLLLWFGDIQVGNSTIIQRIEQLLCQPWYLGQITTADADLSMQSLNKDCFLVRLNLGGTASVDTSPFTISTRQQGINKHSRITFENDRTEYKFQEYGIVITSPNTKEGIFNFIQLLIKTVPQLFHTPCAKWEKPHY